MTTQVFVPVIWELHTQLEETGLAQMGLSAAGQTYQGHNKHLLISF